MVRSNRLAVVTLPLLGGASAAGHGAFTRCLLEALQGRAAVPQENTVTLDELAAYVKDSVPKLTAGLQTPTAAPDEILPFTRIPMARRQ